MSELELDDLLYDAEADPVTRAINREQTRLRAKFDPLIEEISEQEVAVGEINTLTDAANLILIVRAYYHRTQAIYGEAVVEKRQAQIRRDASKSKAEAKVAELVRSDPEVRGIPGHAAQLVRASNKAKTDLALADGCSDLYLLIMGYCERLQLSLENLKACQQDLREYIRTMRDAKLVGETHAVPEGALDRVTTF